MKKILYSLAIISVIFLTGCSSQSSNELDSKTTEAEKVETVKNDLLRQYNAIDFNSREFRFSKDIQDKSSENFLLTNVTIEDIFSKDEKAYIRLRSLYDGMGIFEITDSQLTQIKEANIDPLELFADIYAVVKIDSVSKPRYVYGDIDGEDVDIDIDSSDNFFMKGKLVDIKISKEREP